MMGVDAKWGCNRDVSRIVLACRGPQKGQKRTNGDKTGQFGKHPNLGSTPPSALPEFGTSSWGGEALLPSHGVIVT